MVGRRGREVWRERIRGRIDPHDRSQRYIPLRGNRRDRRVPGSTRRASGHEERTTLTEEAAFTSLSLSLSLSVVPSSVLLSVSSFRLVTGWLGLVGQLVVSRAHVPFDERDSVRKRTTDQPRLSAMGGLRFSSRPSRVCLVVAFHGKGE